MNSIIYDDDIITPKDNKWDYYYDFLNKLNKKDCVKLALFCAKIVNPNTKESNDCISLVEKWLIDEKLVNKEELREAAYAAWCDSTAAASYSAASTIYVASITAYTGNAILYAMNINSAIYFNINKYLQILLRKTKQFENNKVLEQISKVDVDKLELVDWNMITDIIQEEYNIIHEFEYSDIFSRRCLIELLRREYT